ncbi:TPA: hypothetical protein HA270_03310 [Candidatus Woesearchaeota archaeon]|nr:hypothetical protein [Candidatus Woesearchaeota archaeon]
MQKKSQLAIFAILALLLLIMLGAMLLLTREDAALNREAELAASHDVPEEIERVEQFIQACLELEAHKGLLLLGANAGHISPPDILKAAPAGRVLWFHDNINLQPALTESRLWLEAYLNESVERCADFAHFRGEGFAIQAQKPNASVAFSADTVDVSLIYPLDIAKGETSAHLEAFAASFSLRYRRIYEVASQIINRQLDPAFDRDEPLALVDSKGFDVAATPDANDLILYTISDPTTNIRGSHYSFTFASRFSPPATVRTTRLQRNAQVNPTVFPLIVYSPDRLAQLTIAPGTTMSAARPPDTITSLQREEAAVVRGRVPMRSYTVMRSGITAPDRVTYEEIEWPLHTPVYQFEPSGLRFNVPSRLALYWGADNPVSSPAIPSGNDLLSFPRPLRYGPWTGILYGPGIETDDDWGWRPIPSKNSPDGNFVYTDIPGFSEYAGVDCSDVPIKVVSAESKTQKQGWLCWIKLIVVALLLIVLIVAGVAWALGTTIAVPLGFATLELGAVGLSWTSALITALLLGGIVGGAYSQSSANYDAEPGTITFTPTCDQIIYVEKHAEGGKSSCMPTSGEIEAVGGQPVEVAAQIKKCSSLFCGRCSIECAARYR